MDKNPIAILTSDWHLRVSAPASRREPDWFPVMKARLDYLTQLSNTHSGIPIMVAGDVFDRPNPPASLVSWCLDNMPSIIAIPGQHDLPEHRLEARMTGAWGAMVKAGTITDLTHYGNWHGIADANLLVWGMPWNSYNLPPEDQDDGTIKLCLLHKYVWMDNKSKYIGAEDDSCVTAISSWAKHFNAICIGDNHISWRAGKFFNHGSLFSMTSAQVNFEPRVGLLWSDGTMTLEPCTEEKQWQDSVKEVARETQRSGFVAELENLEIDNVSFGSLLSVLEDKSGERVKKIIRELRGAIFGN